MSQGTTSARPWCYKLEMVGGPLSTLTPVGFRLGHPQATESKEVDCTITLSAHFEGYVTQHIV